MTIEQNSAGVIPRDRKALTFERFFLIVMCLLPLAAAMMARGAGYGACGVGLIFFAAWPLVYRERPPVSKPVMVWMIVFCALALLSSLWALDRGVSFDRALKIAPQLITGALLIGLMPRFAARLPRGWLWLLPAFYGIGLIVTTADLYTGLHFYRLAHPGETHVHNDSLNRTILFYTLLYPPVMAAVFALGEHSRRCRRLIAVALSVLLLILLYATASQSSQLAFGLILVFGLLFPYRFRAAWIALVVLIAGLTLGSPWLAEAMFSVLPAAVNKMPFLGAGQGYAANRMEIWDYVSRYALHSPLYGFGIDATRAVPAFDSKQIYQTGLTIPHPHNFAIQLWMEFGVIGALLGAGLLGHMIWFLQSRPVAQQRIALPALIACLSAAAMTFSLWQGWWLGLLFLVAALVRLTMEFYPGENRE